MAKYRKKPVVIEDFRMGIDCIPDWAMDKVTSGVITLRSDRERTDPFESIETWCEIQTLEGKMVGNYGDYIIKGINGELYPCKSDIFKKTYEKVED